MADEDSSRAASKAAFKGTSAKLQDLRPKLRAVVAKPFISHPAYADGNFPIWWQGQNNDQFIKQAKPPFFVRFSHHPREPYQGVLRGHAHIQVYAQTEPWIEALCDLVVGVYPVGETIVVDDYEVLIRSAEAKGVWPVKGWDSTKPWPEKADFMLPISVSWSIVL